MYKALGRGRQLVYKLNGIERFIPRLYNLERGLSVSAARFEKDDKVSGEGIIERLRRLSVSADGEFVPSEGANKVRKRAEGVRQSRDDYTDDRFDQRRVRPGGNWQNRREFDRRPSQNNFDRNRGWGEEEGEEGGNTWGNRRNAAREEGGNSWGDGRRNAAREEGGNSWGDRRRNAAREGGSWDNSRDRNPPRENRSWDDEADEDSNEGDRDPTRDPRLTKFFLKDSPGRGRVGGSLEVNEVKVKAEVSPRPVVTANKNKVGLIEEVKELDLGIAAGMDDVEDDDVKFTPEDKWNMKKLTKEVKSLVDDKKPKEAVDALLGALAEGGFQWDRNQLVYIYNLCISSCAQVGYVEMAFKLFNDMKKRGFPPKQSTYTSLLNACANSPWEAESNLERMSRLRALLLEKGIIPNQLNYHAMIKGYGRCGDIQGAFDIVDEMITQGQIQPNTETFNMLLQACISDKTNGFRHLLVTWRKMQSMGLRPDIFSYNLLLRAIRECGIQALSSDGAEPSDVVVTLPRNEIPRLPPIVTDAESDEMLNLICLDEQEKALTIFNAESSNQVVYTYKDVIQALSTPENRLAVLGGIRGLMSQMAIDKVGPNMKTINELAQIIHPNDASDLLMLMETYKLKPSIDFFNLVIKRSYSLHCDISARETLKSLPAYNLTPNIMTWGVVALGCRSWEQAESFLKEMQDARFTPNIEIMGGLLKQACLSYDPHYVVKIMDEMKKQEVTPDPKFILDLEQFKSEVQSAVLNLEMKKPINNQRLEEELEDTYFENKWSIFKMRYKSWKTTTEIRIEPKNPFEKDYTNFLDNNRTHGTYRGAPSSNTNISTSSSESVEVNEYETNIAKSS